MTPVTKKQAKMEISPRSFRISEWICFLNFIMPVPSLPVVFRHTCTSGHNCEVYQIKIPEAAKLRPPLYSDIKRRTQLDGVSHPRRPRGLVVCVDGISNVVGSGDLGAEKIKQLICLCVDAARELDLFGHLVCSMIQLLLCRDDTKQIDDECKQDDRNKNENRCAKVVHIAALRFQQPADTFEQIITAFNKEPPPIRKTGGG